MTFDTHLPDCSDTSISTSSCSQRSDSYSGATDMRQHINTFASLELGDSSSDDGEQINTPVSESGQLIEIALACGSEQTFDREGDADPFPQSVDMSIDTRNSSSEFSTPSKQQLSEVSLIQNATCSASSDSTFSSFSVSSSSISGSNLDSPSSLETRLSLEDSSLDLYPAAIISSTAPLAYLPLKGISTPSVSSDVSHRPSERLTLQHVKYSSGMPTQPYRKRTLDIRSPLREGSSLKPKFARSFASEFLPSTLAYSYNPRFPPDHRLRSDFVRTYALDGELGKGGYGFVMAATNRHDGREVAVKFIAKSKIPRFGWGIDEFGKDVPKEAVILSKLNHPGIVEFFDLYEDECYFYLVQELHGTPWYKYQNNISHDQQLPLNVRNVLEKQLARNGSPSSSSMCNQFSKVETKDKLQASAAKPSNHRPSSSRRASHDLFECIEQHKNKRLSEEDAKYIFAQVVDIVDYLDKSGFAHCDIKDENIVVDKNLKIKLIDFGSVVQADPTKPRPYYERFYGTAAYAPSEVLRKEPYQAAPAEVWSLGILLSFLRTGSSPFPTDDDRREGRVILDEKNSRDVSSTCLELIKHCLHPDPSRRATIEEIKNHTWLQSGMQRLRLERAHTAR